MSGQVEAYLGSMLSAHADLKDLLEEITGDVAGL